MAQFQEQVQELGVLPKVNFIAAFFSNIHRVLHA
jgi:hypothetical protein